MAPSTVRCLILACGNTLRGDDGVGPWLAGWAEEQFKAELGVRVVSRQQWTPELAEDVAHAETVLFIDCAVDLAPGAVRIARVQPAGAGPGVASHQVGAPELLALGRELYDFLPRSALLLTIGAGSTELIEGFSNSVVEALPQACRMLASTLRKLLG
jgi:hydrogenase maturation protease